ASLFSTQSATTLLEQVRRQIKASNPAPADFALGTADERTVFPLSSITGISFRRQITTAPGFFSSNLATPALSLYPGSVGTVAFGSYLSPDYENASRFIPPTGSATASRRCRGRTGRGSRTSPAARSSRSRLGGFRGLVAQGLAARTPALTLLLASFNENIPLRNLPVVNTDAAAAAMQAVIENTEWASQSGNPVAYAPHLRLDPLEGVPTKSIIFQFARGDKTVPNPTSTAIIRAGDLADRTTLFRNDLAKAVNPAVSSNPHTFLTSIFGASAPYAIPGQDQIAQFFASGGLTTIDPQGAAPFFETPIGIPLPEDLAYIP
ncbi:MAG TPA: hypothetical protein VNI55_13830, partial [Gaiellaceae bacterium]|nr:hypothetical protein [Gaiellaceae bacterium]